MADKKRSGMAQMDLWVAMGVFGLLGIILVPLPTVLLDVLLAGSVSLSLVLFLSTVYVRKPVDFSIFPTVLLAVTMFRLALNIASTRLILLSGGQHGAAGRVIEAFGQFVVGGNSVVGFVLFAILVLINFVVITKGAGRIAEVGARFTLDAMPGKQMAIDAELNAGMIDENTARTRRAAVTREADFYGAMDGASKFVRGDAIAGILITLVNILGGVVIGVVQNGLGVGEALETYTILTIGDGLVGQVPALIVSLAAGLLVTRVDEETERALPQSLGAQLSAEPRVWTMVAAALGFLALIPGIRVPFGILAVGVGYVAWRLHNAPEVVEELGESAADGEAPQGPESLLPIQPLSISIGLDLVYLVDEAQGGDLVERVQRIRNQFAEELGVIVPLVHLQDDLTMEHGAYEVKLRGELIGRGSLKARRQLALDPEGGLPALPGKETVDPVFGLRAWWIDDSQVLQAQAHGFTVVDAPTVLMTHLVELLHTHAHELYDSRQLSQTLERLQEHDPRLVDELVPEPLSRNAVLRVMRNLVKEGVSVRDVHTILEALSDYAGRTKDPDVLTEFVRQRLCRHITHRYLDDDGAVHVVNLSQGVEREILRGLQSQDGSAPNLVVPPDFARGLIVQMKQLTEGYGGAGQAVVLVPPLARGALRRMIERVLPRVAVLSSAELLPTVRLVNEGTISISPTPQPV